MNKKAIELSVNFIVIIIISMVVFGMGLFFANKLFKEAENIKQSLDESSERQIIALLDSGQRLVMPIDNKVVEKGESYVFGLGVLNILGGTRVFEVTLSSSLYIDQQGRTQNPPSISLEFIEFQRRDVKNNERIVFPLVVRVPRKAPAGTYVINVDVSQYEETLQITVRVE